MILRPSLCRRCGTAHQSTWAPAEKARAAFDGQALPQECFAPARQGPDQYVVNVFTKKRINGTLVMPKRRDGVLSMSWEDYARYLWDTAQTVTDKGTIAVTNYTLGTSRRDHNQAWQDRVYFDSDRAGSWDALLAYCRHNGVKAIFTESAGSVKRREEQGDWGNQLPADSWHVEFPLAHRIENPFASQAVDPPQGIYWSHWRKEAKRAYRHMAAVLSGIARFGGVGGSCGFDLSTSALCQMRFLGTRHTASGPTPHMVYVEGDRAIDRDAFLYQTGFRWEPLPDPNATNVRKVVYQTPEGVTRERTIERYDRRLYEDVKARIDCHDFLQTYLGRQPTVISTGRDAYYFCPIHHEEVQTNNGAGPNRTGFHVFTNSAGETLWKCFGDCQGDSGDVVTLAARVYGVSVGKAVWILAELVGLDPKDYLPRVQGSLPSPAEDEVVSDDASEGSGVEEEGVEEEEDADLSGLEQPAPEARPRRKASGYPYPALADWVEKYLVGLPKPGSAVRAVARFVLEADRGGKGAAPAIKLDPDRVAASIYSVLYDTFDEGQAQGEVLDVVDRIQGGRPGSGRGWILRHLGTSAMLALGGALWRDERAAGLAGNRTYKDYLLSSVGWNGFTHEERNFLYASRLSLEQEAEALEKQAAALAGGDDEEGLEVVESPAARRVRALAAKAKAIGNQIRRPTGCGRFLQDVTTSLGRDDGSLNTICGSKTCTYCYMLTTLGEWDIVLKRWEEDQAKRDDKRFFFAQIRLTSFEMHDDLKEYMRRIGRPKLTVLGMEGGKPVLTFVCRSYLDRAYVSASLSGFWGREVVTRGNKDMAESRPTLWEVDTAEEALGLAMEQKMSFHADGRDLIRTKSVSDLKAYLDWSYRKKTVITRTKRGLPWVTKEEVAEAARERNGEKRLDLVPGEERIYELVHKRTGIRLGKQVGRPFSIDQAMTLAARRPEINLALVELEKNERQTRQKRQGSRRGLARAPT